MDRSYDALREHFTRALETYVGLVREDPRVKGLLVSGSYATGRLGPYSDIDVFLLVGNEEEYGPKWETKTVGSVELEIAAYTCAEYREAIEQRVAVKQVIYPLAVGETVFDSDGGFATLKALAQLVAQDLSLRVEPAGELKRDLARPLAFSFRKVGNAYWRQEWDVFHCECGFLLHLFPGLIMRMRGYSVCVDPLAALQRELPHLHALFQRCVEATTPAEKWDGLSELIQAVFTEFDLGELPRAVL